MAQPYWLIVSVGRNNEEHYINVNKISKVFLQVDRADNVYTHIRLDSSADDWVVANGDLRRELGIMGDYEEAAPV